MAEKRQKIIGILGGMGPKATVDIFNKIVDLTPARSDQDHLQILIYNNPRIPDRTRAILGEGESPVPYLVDAARRLEAAGADFIIIPCNTAHFFVEEVEQNISIPVVDMIRETAARIAGEQPPVDVIGLLATEGTITSKIYQSTFSSYNIKVMLPSNEESKIVMEAIYLYKSGGEIGKHRKKLEDIMNKMCDKGAKGIILGCTELPLILSNKTGAPLYIPQDILAEKSVELALS